MNDTATIDMANARHAQMTLVKHLFRAGVKAQKGIAF